MVLFAGVSSLLACGDADHGTRRVADGDVLEPDAARPLGPDVPNLTDQIDPIDQIEPVDSTEPSSEPDCGLIEQAPTPIGCTGPCVCAPDEACTRRLDEDGRCTGECRPASDTLRCDGPVVFGVCHSATGDRRGTPQRSFELEHYEVHFFGLPEQAIVGATYDIALELRSTSSSAVNVRIHATPDPAWAIASDTWSVTGARTLLPGASLRYEARATAVFATTFSSVDRPIATFELDGVVVAPTVTVIYPETEPIACGGYHFPETFDRRTLDGDDYQLVYETARCCGDVFFPAAECCDESGCADGRCVGGKCVTEAPAGFAASRLPLGNQRVRVVFLAFPGALHEIDGFADPCEDRADELRETLFLDDIETWFADLGVRRLGHETVDFRWHITGLPWDASDWSALGDTPLDEYVAERLAERGCEPIDGYDRVVLLSGGLGFHGFYTAEGWGHFLRFDAQHHATRAFAESYGAEWNNVLLDLSQIYYPDALKSLPSDFTPARTFEDACAKVPRDDLAWAELGFSDVDQDGVIDIVEHAAFPTELVLRDVHATVGADGLHVDWEIAARDDKSDIVKRLVVVDYGASVPGDGADGVVTGRSNRRIKTTVLPLSPEARAHVETHGQVEVRFTARHTFTDQQWQPRVLTLDQTVTVPIAR